MFALKIIWLSMIYVTPITKVIIAPATETYRLDFQRCQSNSCQFFRFFCWQYNVANDEARISDVKNALARGEIPEQKKIERVLRDVGLSRTQAKAFMAGGYGALSLRDAEDVGSALNALKNLNF